MEKLKYEKFNMLNLYADHNAFWLLYYGQPKVFFRRIPRTAEFYVK